MPPGPRRGKPSAARRSPATIRADKPYSPYCLPIPAVLGAWTEAWGFLRDLARHGANLHVSIFYEQVDTRDQAGIDHDQKGRIGPARVAARPDAGHPHLMVCSPKLFLAAMINGLKENGISPNRIRFEFFGSHEEELLD